MADNETGSNHVQYQQDEELNPKVQSSHWLSITKSVQSLEDLLCELDETLKHQLGHVHEKIHELVKYDHRQEGESWESLRSAWNSKCRDVVHLKQTIHRLSEEKERLRDENQSLDKGASRLQEQFLHSVDSSLSEIEALTSRNSELTEQIEQLENKIRNNEKSCKNSLGNDIAAVKECLKQAVTENATYTKVGGIIEEEFTKLVDRVHSCLITDRVFDDGVKTALAKSHNVVMRVKESKLQTLVNELRDCRNIIAEKNETIQQLEKDKDSLTKNGVLSLVQDTFDDKHALDGLKRSLTRSNASRHFDTTNFIDTANISRVLRSAKFISQNLREEISTIYKNMMNRADQLSDLRDHIDDANIRLKASMTKIESVEEENEYLRRKLEQEENRLKITKDEIISLQNRVRMLEQENEALETQVDDVKGGKEEFKTFCANLSSENEKMFQEMSQIQLERDTIVDQLQEASRKATKSAQVLKDTEEKCYKLEQSLSKLRREFQEQNRDLHMISKENDELKMYLQEEEHERQKYKNDFKNIDIVNRDLEDQVFQLSNDNQKYQSELFRLRTTKQQLENEVKEKKVKIERLEDSKVTLERQLMLLSRAEQTDKQKSENLRSELETHEEIIEKLKEKVEHLQKIIRTLLKQRKCFIEELSTFEKENSILNELKFVLSEAFAFQSLVEKGTLDENRNEKDTPKPEQGTLDENRNENDTPEPEQSDLIQETYSLVLDQVGKLTGNFHEFKSSILRIDRIVNSTNKPMNTLDNGNELNKIVADTLSLVKRNDELVGEVAMLRRKDRSAKVSSDFALYKDMILRYTVAATKQLEIILDSLSGKECVIMLLSKDNDLEQKDIDGSNADVMHYVRETFKANEKALESIVGTLELVKSRGECDLISAEELGGMNEEEKEIAEVFKRMTANADLLARKVQQLLAGAEIARSSSSGSFEGQDSERAVTTESSVENGITLKDSKQSSLKVKALETLASKQESELRLLRSEVEAFRVEREQLMNELQDKGIDLEKLETEVGRLSSSSGRLEYDLERMKVDYENAVKELSDREQELNLLKEKANDRKLKSEGEHANDISEKEKSVIEKKEFELRRLRSSLDDLRNVHEVHENRIKSLQDKLENVTNLLSEKGAREPKNKVKEQLLVVREIEMKTSAAQVCDMRQPRERSSTNTSCDNNGKTEDHNASGTAESGYSSGNDPQLKRQLQTKENENKFLQSVVREMKVELASLQNSLKNEEQAKRQLQSFLDHVQKSRSNSPTSIRKKSRENDRAYRRRVLQRAGRDRYKDESSDIQTLASDDSSSPFTYNSPMHHRYPAPIKYQSSRGQPYDPHDCEICAMQSMSEASVFPCSDEECDCCSGACTISDASFTSDEEINRKMVLSRGIESVHSRQAKNVSLEEATFVIKTKHYRSLRDGHQRSMSPQYEDRRYYDPIQPAMAVFVPPAAGSTPRKVSVKSKNRYGMKLPSPEMAFKPVRDRHPISDSNFEPNNRYCSSPRSQRSSDESSSTCSGNGTCTGSDSQHDCKKKKRHSFKGKLV